MLVEVLTAQQDHINATNHPINVQPVSKFTNIIGTALWCFLLIAIKVGRKYVANPTKMQIIIDTLEVSIINYFLYLRVPVIVNIQSMNGPTTQPPTTTIIDVSRTTLKHFFILTPFIPTMVNYNTTPLGDSCLYEFVNLDDSFQLNSKLTKAYKMYYCLNIYYRNIT